MKKYLVGLIVLLISVTSFAAKSDTTYRHYAIAKIDHDAQVIVLEPKTDTNVVSNDIDAKFDRAFRPVADAITSVVFYSINFGSIEKEYKVIVEGEDLKGKEIDFSKIKIGDSQSAQGVEILGKDGTLKMKDGKVIIAGTSSEGVKVMLTAPYYSVPLVLIILLLGALFFTIYFAFPNVRLIGTAVRIVRGKYDDIDHHGAGEMAGDSTPGGDAIETIGVEGAEGEVSHFQALTAALSATVGLGNIAGVAIAIALGGPGATFWMIIAGFIGMASKFTECTLGVKYREVDKDGTVYGGPMHYLSKGLKERNMGKLGKVLAIFFAVMCVGGSLGGGNMFQANQAASQFTKMAGLESGWATVIFGIVVSILVGIVIIGGIKKIGKVTERVVPFMAGTFVLAALIILGMNYDLIGTAFGKIFDGAFNASAALGGFVGVLIVGFQRAAFSNEAGVGSAAIAHSAVKTKYPASEGIVALLEPFIDTVVICTMTALVIIITNLKSGLFNYGNLEGSNVIVNGTGEHVGGVDLTSMAFDSAIPHFSIVLTIAVILFAFSTMLSWSYYGLQAWKFLFGKGKTADTVYKILFLLFVVVGASVSLGAVIDFSDAMIFAMVFPNIIGLILLAPKVREELRKYKKAIRREEAKEA
ncbi:MAG: alanine:cation symporter family protein [bacterium]|nr:alanine:cation symporter family protein [bacterium]